MSRPGPHRTNRIWPQVFNESCYIKAQHEYEASHLWKRHEHYRRLSCVCASGKRGKFDTYILTPEVVIYCEILHSKFVNTDVSIFIQMVSVRRLLRQHNGIQTIHDSMFTSMSQLIVLDLSHNLIKYVPQITLCFLRKSSIYFFESQLDCRTSY